MSLICKANSKETKQSRRPPRIYYKTKFKNVDLDTKQYPLIYSNLNSVYQVIQDATLEFSRITAFRIDLRYPKRYENDERVNVISRFFRSLDSQVHAELIRRKSKGKSVSRENIRYIWCKEIDSSDKPHYHVVIIVNKDNFRSLGDYKNLERRRGSCKHVYDMVVDAWTRALDIDREDAIRAVHVPENPTYHVIQKHQFDDTMDEDDVGQSFERMFNALFNRAVYLTKYRTRAYGKGRTFGTSHRSNQDREREFFHNLMKESLFDVR